MNNYFKWIAAALVAFSFWMGWILRGTTPVKEEVVTREQIVATTTVSILEEEQKCKEAGGIFYIHERDPRALYMNGNWEENDRYRLWCERIPEHFENVFDYKIQ